MSTTTPEPDRFVREAEEKRLTGLSRTTRWRLEKQGKYPRRYRISANAKARLFSEIMEWMRERIEQGKGA